MKGKIEIGLNVKLSPSINQLRTEIGLNREYEIDTKKTYTIYEYAGNFQYQDIGGFPKVEKLWRVTGGSIIVKNTFFKENRNVDIEQILIPESALILQE